MSTTNVGRLAHGLCKLGMVKLSSDRIQEAVNYIQEHLSEDISLEAIANYLSISPYYLSHVFKQSMGIAPYQYVLQQRVERAKRLLKESELTIAEIALDCGFANQAHLAKHFRNIVGISPRAYRETELN